MSADKAQRIRPWDYTQCRDHYRELKLAEHFEASPKILDVGFGKERRSTLALRAIFPRSEIVAIDSNLNYCKQAIESSEDADKARFLFSDVDLLDIPGGQTYDLVVFCMTLFCLQNPLRAIGTITSRALTNNGIVLITQRTDPVMRALCDLPPIESEGERDRLNGYSAYRIRNFWKNINARAASNNLLLVYPWRFRLVCDLDPVVSSVGDIGYEDVTMGDIVRKGNVTMRYPEEVKQSGDYPPLGDQEHLETYGSVLGGPIGSMSEPQYSRMKWAWHQFKENRVEWPRVVDETAPLSIQSVSLSSRLFKLTKTVGVESEHPFRTFTAPLKILPNTWRCRREDLPVEAKNAVRSWITKRKLEDSVIGFYLLSPHGVSGQQENPAPLALYEDPSGVQPIQGSLDELQLSSFLERRESNSTVIQFYRIGSKQLWDKDTAASTFLVEAADPVQMLAFPIFLSEDENNDLEEIRKRLTEMEKPLQMRNSSTDVELQAVARYLRKRGEWMRDNVAYGIYYYYRHNPPVDNRPVSRGASMLVTETLPIEVTLEFLVLAEEVIQNYQSQRYVHLINQRRDFSEKAGRAGILIRNLSHHIGSHVLVKRQDCAEKQFAQLMNKAIDPRAGANNLFADSKFYTYIRERMEFLAMLSLDAQLWSMPAKVKDLFAFLEDESKSAILRDNIGANERVAFKIVSAPKDVADEIIALPWGTTGLHAFYTLVEGILRNACRHGQIPKPIDGAISTLAELIVRAEKPTGETDPIWLYCGVLDQAVEATDTATAILKSINPDKDVSGDPIERLKDFLKNQGQITRPDGGYAHGALGIMEMEIAANFLSCGEAGLQVLVDNNKLFMGFKLTRPKEMYEVDPNKGIPLDFRYDYESYLAKCASVQAEGDDLPQFPLGPRTLYVTDGNCDTTPPHRYAHITKREWDRSQQDPEAVASCLLRTRHAAEDFRVVIVGKQDWPNKWSWNNSGSISAEISFINDGTKIEDLKNLVIKCCAEKQRTLFLAHGDNEINMEKERKNQSNGGCNVRVFRISDGDLICRQYVAACIRQHKWNALRLLLWEAAFLKYEIYDDRMYGQFQQYRTLMDDKHIALLNEVCIGELEKACYTKDIVRIVHVSPWNELQKEYNKNGKTLDWKSFYPNIVFHSARGGDVITTGKWDFPRLDYSSVVRVLESVTTDHKMDALIRLALLTQRIGCSQNKLP